MCNNCIHKPVCSKHIACGEVNSCEHHKEERKGRWINITDFGDGNCYGFCSFCGTDQPASSATALRINHKHCRWCGADMKGD